MKHILFAVLAVVLTGCMVTQPPPDAGQPQSVDTSVSTYVDTFVVSDRSVDTTTPAPEAVFVEEGDGYVVLHFPNGSQQQVASGTFFACVSGMLSGTACPGMETDAAVAALRVLP